MTKQEFLKYLKEHKNIYSYVSLNPEERYSREDFAKYLSDPRRESGDSHKIIDFFEGMEMTMFDRVETGSGDILKINIFYNHGVRYWEDIGCMVNFCGWIHNCAVYEIESFYISEQGKFYNQDHKLIAENEDGFFDYVTTVEYDFHPEIPPLTYQTMRQSGWYEGRRIDTTEFEQKMKQRGIEFTKSQLDFLSEFSDLYFEFSDYYYWKIYPLDRISE